MATQRPGNLTTGSASSVGDTPEEILGNAVVLHLHNMLKSARMYGPDHPVVSDQAQRFVDGVSPLFQQIGAQEVPVLMSAEHVYVNRVPVRPAGNQLQRTAWLMEQLGALDVSEIVLRNGLLRNDVHEMARRMTTALAGETPREPIRDLSTVSIVPKVVDDTFGELTQQLIRLRRFPILQTYAEGLAKTRQWVTEAHKGHATDVVAAKRQMGQLIDALLVEPGATLAMLALRPMVDTYSNRRFDVALLSAALGLKMNLDDADALALGVSALIKPMPSDWGRWWKRREYDRDVAVALASGARNDFERIVSFEGVTPPGVAMPAAAYGTVVARHPASLIQAVAEAYVDLLQPGDDARPLSPDAAVHTLVTHADRLFDGQVLAALVALLGYYPPGLVVRLNSGDLAIVVDPPPAGEDPARPSVRPVDAGEGSIYALWRPELASYHITGVAGRSECSVNPFFVLLQ